MTKEKRKKLEKPLGLEGYREPEAPTDCPCGCGGPANWVDGLDVLTNDSPGIKLQENMTREGLLELHRFLSKKALELMRVKNRGYANVSDPFKNFRHFGLLGILVRLSDKLARLQSFVEQGIDKVQDESVMDTCLDILNYSILFLGYCITDGKFGPLVIPAEPETGQAQERLCHP